MRSTRVIIGALSATLSASALAVIVLASGPTARIEPEAPAIPGPVAPGVLGFEPDGATKTPPPPETDVWRSVTGTIRPPARPTTTKPAPKSAPRPAPTTKAPAPAPTSFRSALAAAIASVPGASSATWHPTAYPGRTAWGVTAFASCEVWINPATPIRYVDDVVKHEYVHVRQCRLYGSVSAATAAVGNIEINADCGARYLLGATWTNYVRSCTAAQIQQARSVLYG